MIEYQANNAPTRLLTYREFKNLKTKSYFDLNPLKCALKKYRKSPRGETGYHQNLLSSSYRFDSCRGRQIQSIFPA